MTHSDTSTTPQSRGSGSALVPSTAVDGTDVYGRDGRKVGHIDHLMIDKQSGNVAYAVMHFGGFLGLGEQEHTVPWRGLSYDTSLGGFVTDITEEQLEGAPRPTGDWTSDRDYEARLHDHYQLGYYWI